MKQRFEYKLWDTEICEKTGENVESLGKNGWDLVSVVYNTNIDKYTLFFKRPYEN